MKNLWLCVGLMAVLTACGDAPTASTSVDTATNESSSANTAPVTEVVEVDAKKLFADYSANEVKADSMYKGKTLKVTGVVDSIESGLMDEAMLMLKSANEFEHVMATVSEAEKAKAAELTKGQTVVVQCVSDGEIMGSPNLRECKIL